MRGHKSHIINVDVPDYKLKHPGSAYQEVGPAKGCSRSSRSDLSDRVKMKPVSVTER